MKESKQSELHKEKNLEQPTPNNNLLIVLGVLVLIIIGLVIYAMSPGKTPSSLVDQAAQISPVEVAPAEQEEEAVALPVVSQPEPGRTVKPAASAPEKVAAAPKTPVNAASKEYVHTVKAGETLFNITKRFNMPQQAFKDLNKLADNNLQIGQQVKVKVTAIHEVKPSEGLKAIADKYQVSKELIMKANNLQDESLQLNQQLIIPLP